MCTERDIFSCYLGTILHTYMDILAKSAKYGIVTEYNNVKDKNVKFSK